MNFEGHLRRLLYLLKSGDRGSAWQVLQLTVAEFADLGLMRESSDRDVWNTCQREGFVLLTGNRNHDGSDSLEAVIFEPDAIGFLPVFTVSDPDRVLADRLYAERIADDLLLALIDLGFDETYFAGAGRIYLPRHG